MSERYDWLLVSSSTKRSSPKDKITSALISFNPFELLTSQWNFHFFPYSTPQILKYKTLYRKFRTISSDFFPALSTLRLIQWHDLCSNSVFFLQLPGNVLGVAHNQVRLIVLNLWCSSSLDSQFGWMFESKYLLQQDVLGVRVAPRVFTLGGHITDMINNWTIYFRATRRKSTKTAARSTGSER